VHGGVSVVVRTRWLVVPAFVVSVLLSSGGPAAAKLPPWTCELSTNRPVVHDPMTIVVRFWHDAAHTRPSRWRLPRILQFIELRGDLPEGRGHSQDHVTLLRSAPDTYKGTLLFSDTRRYEIHPCGTGYDENGYPIGVLVVHPIKSAARGAATPWIGSTGDASAMVTALTAAGLAATGLFAVILLRRDRRVRGSRIAGG
jgi:hypothetical protein